MSIRKMLSRKFWLFLLAGGTSAVANIMLRVVLTPLAGFPLSVAIAYAIGMVIAYVLSSRYVFVHATASRRRSMAGFGLVNVVSGTQTLLVSMGLRTLLLAVAMPIATAELAAHGLALTSTVVTSYLGHKHISFRERQP